MGTDELEQPDGHIHMTYDSAAWTGLAPRRRYRTFPLFGFMLVTPWFGIHIGQMMAYACYGVEVTWGYIPPAPIVPCHQHHRRWVWFTAEQLMNRP